MKHDPDEDEEIGNVGALYKVIPPMIVSRKVVRLMLRARFKNAYAINNYVVIVRTGNKDYNP